MQTIDLRSDTVTSPTPAMREAMSVAKVGDDVYAEDPTANAFEKRIAAAFGHEASLFMPTGSLANQIAMRLLVAPGEELICESMAHVARAELGAAAVFSGITFRTLREPRGILNAKRILDFITPNAGPHLVSTTAVAVENTHNFGGGSIQPIDEIESLRHGLIEQGVKLHLDGARLWNAHVATGIPLNRFGKAFDTLSVCMSKGLGAPIGSFLISSQENIDKARIWRKRYGGGMRQIGVIASAAEYAFDNHIERLAEDHKNAQIIAKAVSKVNSEVINPEHVETNILVFDMRKAGFTSSEFINKAASHGIKIGAIGPMTARAITHLDVSQGECEFVAETFAKIFNH